MAEPAHGQRYSDLQQENAALRAEVEEVKGKNVLQAARACELHETIDALRAKYAALLERHKRLVEQVKRITNHEAYKAVKGTLEFAEDARYTWPTRYKWITDLLEAALAEEE